MSDFYGSIRGIGGVDPLHPGYDREVDRERRRGRDSSGRQWTQQEEDESQIAEQFQATAAPIRPTAPERRIRAVVQRGSEPSQWARHHLRTLTLRQKIGQLLMLVVDGPFDEEELIATVRNYSVGILLFASIDGEFADHIRLVERLQSAVETPLLIGLIWGGGSMVEEGRPMPCASTLSRMEDRDLLREIGKESALQYKLLGIHLLLFAMAPRTAELAHQVGERLFLGGERVEVTANGIALARGFKEAGVIGMPQTCLQLSDEEEQEVSDWIVSQLIRRLSHFSYDQIRPFREMAQGGVDPILLPHMLFPVLFGRRKEESYHPQVGLAFGHLLYQPEGWRSPLLLTSGELEQVVALLEVAVAEGAITEGEIDQKALALLRAKEGVGLHKRQESRVASEPSQLEKEELNELRLRGYRAALIVRRNDPTALPLPEHVGLLEIDAEGESRFAQELKRRSTVSLVSTTAFALEDPAHEEVVIQQFQENRAIVVALYDDGSLAPKSLEVIHRLRLSNKQVILVAFLPPALLAGLGKEAAIVVAHETDPAAQRVAAEALYS